MLEREFLKLTRSAGNRVDINSAEKALGFAHSKGGILERVFLPRWQLFELEDEPLLLSLQKESWLGAIWSVWDSEDLTIGWFQEEEMHFSPGGETIAIEASGAERKFVNINGKVVARGRLMQPGLELVFSGADSPPFIRMLVLAWGILRV